MFRLIPLLLLSQLIAFTTVSFAGEAVTTVDKHTLIAPKQPPKEEVPLIVIYTLSTCPHCLEAKEYLKSNKIIFINREVDSDDEHMAELMKIYDSMNVPEQKRGVPLFVIGNRIIIQGFSRDKLLQALKEVTHSSK